MDAPGLPTDRQNFRRQDIGSEFEAQEVNAGRRSLSTLPSAIPARRPPAGGPRLVEQLPYTAPGNVIKRETDLSGPRHSELDLRWTTRWVEDDDGRRRHPE